MLINEGPRKRAFFLVKALSFRGGSKSRTRSLEIPGSMLRIAPE
jgi:hypothetical protein